MIRFGNINKSIWIKTSFNALHHWPECPHEDVSFLRDKHRHTFYVKVQIEVDHNDRAIEFVQFKKFIDKLINENYKKVNGIIDLGRKSCEDIACELCDWTLKEYRSNSLLIEVSEDGEVGATIQWELGG